MIHLLLAVIYLAFISLGLPDSILGAAWPTMYKEFDAPLSYAGVISMIIAAATIVSSLMSDRLTKKLGAGLVTAISVAMTAVSLFGFSLSHEFWMLCLIAVPYGLGAGSVDAALNNYVALHYKSRHMSWLHCMWGVGASLGPYIMGATLAGGDIWNSGYRTISIIQVVLTALLFVSLPLWKKHAVQSSAASSSTEANPSEAANPNESSTKVLSLKEIFGIPGAKAVMLCFFCYCALEQTAGLWAASFLNLGKGVDVETAATFASLFYVGITVGRAISGFVTFKLNDAQMIRLGAGIIAAGVACMFIPFGSETSLVGLVLIGLGCAPIYPSIIHSTPEHFGADKSQAIIGVQMASAYVGTCVMPTLFGLVANHISVTLLPVYLAAILALMFVMHEKLVKTTAK